MSEPHYDREYSRTIAEIREWLVKIDTNQTHQTELLETINRQATNAFTKADKAEDTANEARTLAEQTKKRFDDYEKEAKVNKRWLIGLFATIGLALLNVYI